MCARQINKKNKKKREIGPTQLAQKVCVVKQVIKTGDDKITLFSMEGVNKAVVVYSLTVICPHD